jgi:hypothetical protein
MVSRRAAHLVVPQEQDWPVQSQEDDGHLILRDGFVDDVEHVNGLEQGSLSEDQIVTLLLAWYSERRRIGFPEDPMMEHAARLYSAA